MWEYEKEDFASEAPYRELMEIRSPFERNIAIERMAEYAKEKGIHNFKKMFSSFQDSLKQKDNVYIEDSMTTFSGQKLELNCGKWRCDDFGVSRDGIYGEEIACPHPILPIERLVNIDTGEEKLRISYSKGKKWREQIVPRSILASANKIVELSSVGVAVTSENSRLLVRYLSEIENMNYDLIPEKNSIGRLGYIGEGEFSPYLEGLVFDGDADYRSLYESVRTCGSGKEWVRLAMECRQMSLTAKIMLAASFASVLIEPLGCLPFFVHLWGGDSGSGKTVSLMLAASVWGNPEKGKYMQTFNGTVVGFEKVAAFLNSLPYCIDELQLVEANKSGQKFNVYLLAQGVGRTRGNKTGGLQKTPTWPNCMLTTGESPLVKDADGAGAINRVIEIEGEPGQFVIHDGRRYSGELRKHYGHAGRAFVKKLYSNKEILDELKLRYDEVFRELSASNTTEKQAMAAALIVAADELASKWIFHDKPITVPEIATMLKTKESVDVGRRGYNYMCDWVAQNSLRMQRGIESGEIYGLIEGDVAYIIRSVFDQAVEKGGFSSAVLLSYFKAHGLIDTPGKGKGNTKTRRIGGSSVHCVCLRLPVDSEGSEEEAI